MQPFSKHILLNSTKIKDNPSFTCPNLNPWLQEHEKGQDCYNDQRLPRRSFLHRRQHRLTCTVNISFIHPYPLIEGSLFFRCPVGRVLHSSRPLCFGGRIDLPDITDPATPNAAASDGLSPSVYSNGMGINRTLAWKRSRRMTVSKTGEWTKLPSVRKTPAGARTCRWGCQSRNSPAVWMETMATGRCPS